MERSASVRAVNPFRPHVFLRTFALGQYAEGRDARFRRSEYEPFHVDRCERQEEGVWAILHRFAYRSLDGIPLCYRR